MRFLVDAQLPPLLCDILVKAGFQAMHVDNLPAGDETADAEIIRYADANGFTVISKDSDFYHSHMINRQPEKLLLITTGNMKNRQLFDLIRKHADNIRQLFAACNYVELNNDGLIGHEE